MNCKLVSAFSKKVSKFFLGTCISENMGDLEIAINVIVSKNKIVLW